MTEDHCRWRGAHLLEALAAHMTHQLTWRRIDEPLHANVNRGIFDPTHGKYDTEAGMRVDMGGPRVATLVIHPNPRHPGECITTTPSWLDERRRELARMGLLEAVEDYARRQGDPNTRMSVAQYWPSRNRVMWANRAPRELQEAALHLGSVEPMNANHVRAYARLQERHQPPEFVNLPREAAECAS